MQAFGCVSVGMRVHTTVNEWQLFLLLLPAGHMSGAGMVMVMVLVEMAEMPAEVPVLVGLWFRHTDCAAFPHLRGSGFLSRSTGQGSTVPLIITDPEPAPLSSSFSLLSSFNNPPSSRLVWSRPILRVLSAFLTITPVFGSSDETPLRYCITALDSLPGHSSVAQPPHSHVDALARLHLCVHSQ